MIKLKSLLKESMYVYIRGMNYNRRLDTIFSISRHLTDKVLIPVINKIPDDQKRYLDKNKVNDYYELLTIDGFDVDNPIGTLNFYISGFTTNTIREILKRVIKELKLINVKIGKMRREQSNMYNSEVIRIPIIENKNEYNIPELNLSNRNAYHIFKNVLMYEPVDKDGYEFRFSPADVIERINGILNHDPSWMEKTALKTKVISPEDSTPSSDETDKSEDDSDVNPHDIVLNKTGGMLGATQINFGLDPSAIEERLLQIKKIAEFAIKNGYSEIYVN